MLARLEDCLGKLPNYISEKEDKFIGPIKLWVCELNDLAANYYEEQVQSLGLIVMAKNKENALAMFTLAKYNMEDYTLNRILAHFNRIFPYDEKNQQDELTVESLYWTIVQISLYNEHCRIIEKGFSFAISSKIKVYYSNVQESHIDDLIGGWIDKGYCIRKQQYKNYILRLRLKMEKQLTSCRILTPSYQCVYDLISSYV